MRRFRPYAAALWAVLCGLVFLPETARAQVRAVELELALAVDVSTSVDEDEFRLQISGIADAFRQPSIIRAIEKLGSGGMSVTLIQWSGRGRQAISVDWMLLSGRGDALRFAEAVMKAPRLFTGFTNIPQAIRYALEQIEQNAYEGRRKVIDVSGDGSSSVESPRGETSRAVARGVTVNGLAILTRDPDFMELGLKDYYATEVIGGPGSFSMAADGFEDFAVVMARKLLREIRRPAMSHLIRHTPRQPGGEITRTRSTVYRRPPAPITVPASTRIHPRLFRNAGRPATRPGHRQDLQQQTDRHR